MTIPSVVEELIERFENNKEQLKSSNYKELRLRREFVDPFFESLGWDVGNKDGFAEAYKDVIIEDSLKIGGSSKAPDYAFRIGGTRKFFVETKVPSIFLKDSSESAFQLRRYGWSAKLPISILTNFEEFSVYDCRIKPSSSDKASKGRIFYITYKDYQSKWDEISSIFSKTSISKGAFDKFAEDATKKRGTAQVDTAFLSEIEGWRESLAKNIALRNPGLSVRELNSAVQRTIDRIIFLRIAEDRGIEPYGRLRGLITEKDAYRKLGAIFQQADARYNSGLFHFDQADGSAETLDTYTLGLSIDDKVLKDLFRSLYYPESPYEFGVLPADILGQVYEQFLGKVIKLSGKSAVVEEKPEVKKAGGVFYTPTFVVHHIVQNALAPLLVGKTPAQIGAASKGSKKPQSLRILDPACGSGSFLIEAYQHLLDWYRDWYIADGANKHVKGKEPRLYKASNGEWRLSIAEKRRILLTHIYGVDIDAQAVEVTKLSLLLKVLENENADVIAAQMNLFHKRALPDLGNNIKCGNSLVDYDYYDSPINSLLSDEDRVKINAFDWSDEFSFQFDAIIGNPPYGASYTDHDKIYFKGKYHYKSGKPDTYLFFIEQGIRLLKPNGVLGYIVPNSWLTNFYGLSMRDYILANVAVQQIVDLEPVRVFKNAVVDTCIIVIQNTTPSESHRISIERGKYDRSISSEFLVSQSQWTADREKLFNVYAGEVDLRIMAKMQDSGRTLQEVVEFSQGVIPYLNKSQGEKNAYISSTKHGPEWKPLLESASQVETYKISSPKNFIHYGKWLCRPRESKYFENSKILFHRVRKKLPQQLVGAIDTSRAVNRHALSNLILLDHRSAEELWAALALFNSGLANWWFVHRYGPLMEVGGFKVQTIPLPETWDKIYPALADAAKSITDAAKKVATSKDSHTRSVLQRGAQSSRKKIEKVLARAYGLTDEDVSHTISSFQKIVERSRDEETDGDLEEIAS